MKLLHLLILIVFSSSSLLFGEEKAEDAYRKMLEHMINNEHEKAYSYVIPFTNKRHIDLVKMNLKKDSAKFAKGALNVEVITSKQGEQWAIVVVKYNDDIHTNIMALHNSTWKVRMEDGVPYESLKNHSKEELANLKQWLRDNHNTFRTDKATK